MKQLSRRDFLKVAAMTGAGVLTGMSPTVRRVALEPYVRPPEEELPGRATWYASTCRQCPAGCGIVVRVINGRARKIEGNPAHPLNRGKLCARGQAGLQVLYNPDRLQNAVRQSGGRGSRQFKPIQWIEAIDQLSSAFKSLGAPSRVAFLGGLMSDHLLTLVSGFLKALGAPPPVLFDLHTALEGRAEATDMARRWFGNSQAQGVPLPLYDIARAQVVFSFGANLLETWMSPVAQSRDYGLMRQGQAGGRGLLVQFEPRLSMTAASADKWIPVKPGTEGLIALGLGRIIVEDNLGQVGSHNEHAHLYRNVSVADVADASGVSVETLRRLANAFAAADHSVAIPGGYLAGLGNGSQTMDAVLALNVLMRRLGREGGVFLPHQVPAEPFASSASVSSFAQVTDLIERLKAGQVDILLIHGCNPLYELPQWTGIAEAIRRVPLVISFSSCVDETDVLADLVLPDHTYLEGWGYQVVSPGADRPAVSGQQPVVRPLYDTRATGDVMLALAARIGGQVAQALPWSDEVAFLEQNSAQLLGTSSGIYDAHTPAGFWSLWRQHGGWWTEKPLRDEPEAVGTPTGPLQVSPAVFAGDAQQHPFHLIPYPSLALSDGRGANQPWLQEMPDPMTTASWNTWVELNPATARSLQVDNNDVVKVVSPYGELHAPVVVYPGIRPDAVAIPIGQGHRDYGRFAQGRGSNPLALLAPPSEQAHGSWLPWGATRVRIERTGRKQELARVESLDGAGREKLR